MPKHHRGIVALGAIVASMLGACGGSGHTFEVQRPSEGHRFEKASIREGTSQVNVPDDDRRQFAGILEGAMKAAAFENGEGLIVTYRFVQFQEGAQVARVFLHGVGDGSLSIEAEFSDQAGTILGKIITEGRVSTGWFGGRFRNAMEQAAKHLAKYAADHFH